MRKPLRRLHLAWWLFLAPLTLVFAFAALMRAPQSPVFSPLPVLEQTYNQGAAG